jgi:FkbM family methyltransferase
MNILDHIAGIVAARDVTILELGCYDGNDTTKMRKCCAEHAKSHRHIALEANPKLIKHAKGAFAHPGMELIQAAVCEFDGEVDLHVSTGSAGCPAEYLGSSSINRPTGVRIDYPRMRFDETLRVPAITLDSLVASRGITRVDFIWADIEGAEKRMIAGGLRRCFPMARYFYTEYSNGGLFENDATLDDIRAMLPDWEIAEDYGGNVLLVNIRLAGEWETKLWPRRAS